jgi:hypothetical protein
VIKFSHKSIVYYNTDYQKKLHNGIPVLVKIINIKS